MSGNGTGDGSGRYVAMRLIIYRMGVVGEYHRWVRNGILGKKLLKGYVRD